MIELIRGSYNLTAKHRGCVATIGNFDGLHLGHQKVLEQLREKAQQLNLPSLLITFEPLPQEYFRGTAAPARLLRLREKLMLLATYKIDRVLCLRFNQKLAQLPAAEFVQQILVSKLGIKWLIVGDDFRFGAQRQGDFALLTQLGEKHGFAVTPTTTVTREGVRIGSSRVRTALDQGDLTLAKQLLGRPYRIGGHVIHGDKRGRQLGFPTANIPLRRWVKPLQGVFTVLVHGVGDKPLPAVANIGTRPSVDGNHSLLEVYLLDFKQDIYGHYLQIEFLQKLRDEQRFASLEELKTQISKDIATARELFRH